MGSGEEDTGGGGAVRGAVLKALVVVGGVLLLRRLRRSTTRWDHARAVADALSGEKVSPPRAPSWRKCSAPGALRFSRSENSFRKIPVFPFWFPPNNFERRGIESLCLDDAFLAVHWHLTGSLVCWFAVQFSREQARKDPDNYFNLRSDIRYYMKCCILFSRTGVSTVHFIRVLVSLVL
jgi:hypothetical protein